MDDEDIRELFALLGPVPIRRMVSEKGIHYQGLIIAIFYGNELQLKVGQRVGVSGCRVRPVGLQGSPRHGADVLLARSARRLR